MITGAAQDLAPSASSQGTPKSLKGLRKPAALKMNIPPVQHWSHSVREGGWATQGSVGQLFCPGWGGMEHSTWPVCVPGPTGLVQKCWEKAQDLAQTTVSQQLLYPLFWTEPKYFPQFASQQPGEDLIHPRKKQNSLQWPQCSTSVSIISPRCDYSSNFIWIFSYIKLKWENISLKVTFCKGWRKGSPASPCGSRCIPCMARSLLGC